LEPFTGVGFATGPDRLADTAFVDGTTFAAARAELCAATEALLSSSFVVLEAVALADAFEALAFSTTAPFLVSAATMVVGAIVASSCGEGDRR
jgi:hypothetical protein